MDQQAFTVYVNERYMPELARNHSRMKWHRRICRLLQIGELTALLAVLTFLLLRRHEPSAAWWMLGLCILALACAVAQRAFHYDRQWIQEAQTIELLRQEWEFYHALSDGYGPDHDPHRLFIHRIESHLSRSRLFTGARTLFPNPTNQAAAMTRPAT